MQAIITKREDDGNDGESLLLQVKTEDGTLLESLSSDCCLQNERDDTVDDLVRSDFLHEPG